MASTQMFVWWRHFVLATNRLTTTDTGQIQGTTMNRHLGHVPCSQRFYQCSHQPWRCHATIRGLCQNHVSPGVRFYHENDDMTMGNYLSPVVSRVLKTWLWTRRYMKLLRGSGTWESHLSCDHKGVFRIIWLLWKPNYKTGFHFLLSLFIEIERSWSRGVMLQVKPLDRTDATGWGEQNFLTVINKTPNTNLQYN